MWKQQKLQHSPKIQASLSANLRGEISPLNLSTTGVKIGVHNWYHGIEEKSNKYLSPENAIKVFQKKLTDYADNNRPKGIQDVICIMIATPDISSFITSLEQVAILLPEPVFKQAYDYAQSSKNLADTKMIKTPQITSPAFAKAEDITPQSSRTIQSIMRNIVATATTSSNDPSVIMQMLKDTKARRQAENQQKIAKILNTNATIFSFQGRGELEEIALQLNKNIPNPSYIFTASICFIGKDLTHITEMLHDLN